VATTANTRELSQTVPLVSARARNVWPAPTTGATVRQFPVPMSIAAVGAQALRVKSMANRSAQAESHQGIAQRVPDAGRDAPWAAMIDLDVERIRRKPILNGLINEYAHAA
jgi:hypothetical protein